MNERQIDAFGKMIPRLLGWIGLIGGLACFFGVYGAGAGLLFLAMIQMFF